MIIQFFIHLIFYYRLRYILMYDRSIFMVPLFNKMKEFVIKIVILNK